MTIKKRVRVSTAIKHALDALDNTTPITPDKATPSVIDQMETLIWKDLGYELEEARRMANWLAGQSKDANPHDLAEGWCSDDRMPFEWCNVAHHNGLVPCAQCGCGLMVTSQDAIFCPRCTENGAAQTITCKGCGKPIVATPLALEERICIDCIKLNGIDAQAMNAARQKPAAAKPLSLEEQRRILHETGLFDEMGNFKVPEQLISASD